MNVREELEARLDLGGALVNDVEVDASSVKVVMINEVVPPDPSDDFYSGPGSEYALSAGALFERAGAAFSSPAGGNIQIEKSKVQMITEDIAEMIGLIGA
ncbi:hypothetical protein [Parvibacter caecicola]|uniref:hypothetical protein n=1 Tax=Parvibacter caecicola TaxID=747645 RepID=UPI00249BA785|nr:hypothetical protein [Parvibacter caecicola]